MIPPSPHMLALGVSQPPNQIHAVSVSMPTWESVTGWGKREDCVVEKMQTVYPRFYVHKLLRMLSEAVRKRIALPQTSECMIFPSEKTANRFISGLRSQNAAVPIDSVWFTLHQVATTDEEQWASFYAIIYGDDMEAQALKCWCIIGDGISSRHAEFCLERFDFMKSVSSNPCYITCPTFLGRFQHPGAPPRMDFGTGDKEAIKSLIARLAKSEKPGSAEVTTRDIFLYPKGMAAINAVARAVFKTMPRGVDPQAIIYGWSYADTPKCLPMNGYARFKMYPNGTQEELYELEASLQSDNRISILFCEVPSNPLLESVDMERIRSLAMKYNFIVACDQTLAAFANLDLLPYADILMDSLTKMFSGSSNVMAGSVIVNPQSKHYDRIHSALVDDFEDVFFPLDAEVLAENSADFEHRILRSNRNAMAIAMLMSLHPSVERIYYPKMASSAALFEKYRRDTGGYGFLLSILFRQPSSAVCFYDALDVCKGPSIGTNFTLAVPYTQLAHFKEMDWAESCGVSKYIVRISVGLEEEEQVLDRVRKALQIVEFKAQRDRGTFCQDRESSNGTAELINYN